MRRKIGEQRIEPVIWIAAFVEAKVTGTLAALHQLRRCIMMLKINNHPIAPNGKSTRKQYPMRGLAGRLRHKGCDRLLSVSYEQSTVNYSFETGILLRQPRGASMTAFEE
jgi:hypothetical protein